MKKSGPFRFKLFEVNHDLSSMKVGVDAVLTGALAPVEGVESVLDAGCGCGVISLMIAQRAPSARITGVDIDAASIKEAEGNFRSSPWADRLRAEQRDFNSVDGQYDLIVSNPPFFRSGVVSPDTARLSARHQDSLSPFVLLKAARRLLGPGGRVCCIFPAESEDDILEMCKEEGLRVIEIVRVRGHSAAPVKRIVIVAGRGGGASEQEGGPDGSIRRPGSQRELILEQAPGLPTDAYRSLCRDFYLKF